MHPETRKRIEEIRDQLTRISNEIGCITDDGLSEQAEEQLDIASGLIEDVRQELRKACVQM